MNQATGEHGLVDAVRALLEGDAATDDALVTPYRVLWPAHLAAIEAAAAEFALDVDVGTATDEALRFDMRYARTSAQIVGTCARALLELVTTAGDGHATVRLTVAKDDRATTYALWSDRVTSEWTDHAQSWARVELLEVVDRFGGTAILANPAGCAMLTVALPHRETAATEAFTVLVGAARPVVVASSDLEDALPGGTGLVPELLSVVDLCPEGHPAESHLRVRVGHALHVEIACPGRPEQIRGVAVPAACVPSIHEVGFDFAAVTADGVFAVLDPSTLRNAHGSPDGAVAA